MARGDGSTAARAERFLGPGKGAGGSRASSHARAAAIPGPPLPACMAAVLRNAGRAAPALLAAAAEGAGGGGGGVPLEGEPWLRREWQPHELEVMVRVARSMPLDDRSGLQRLRKELGWPHRPGTATSKKLRSKFGEVRICLAVGVDPLADRRKTVNARNRWQDWILRVFHRAPDRQATLAEVKAAIAADPDISPLLDRRPNPLRRSQEVWERRVQSGFYSLPGVQCMAEMRGGQHVYYHDPQAPPAAAAAPRALK